MTAKNLILLLWICTCSLFAASPKTVTYDSKTDFDRGTLNNLAISHDGKLKTAPGKTLLMDTDAPFLWAMVEDSKGNLYLGTGNEGKLFKRSANGDSSLIFDADELFIFALAIDSKDNVYAATSPNGAVYKITTQNEVSTFFDTEATYIWDLAIDAQNNLLVATGEPANIYRVSPNGQSSVIFETEENHVRTLVVNGDHVYAGTSGNGFIYKLSANTAPFVIFDPQMEEVNDLIVKNDGTIYASAFGQSMTAPTPRRSQNQQNQNDDDEGEDDEESEAELTSQTINLESLVRAGSAPTSLFKITPDGYAKDLWRGSDEKIQSIFPYGDTILVGSGKSGKLLTVDDEGDISIIMENKESHITAIIQNSKNHLLFATSNLGRVYQMQDTSLDSATLVSETIDAGLPAQWGVLVWRGNDVAKPDFFTRSGNTEQPSQTWSKWEAVTKDGEVSRINSPNARFIQWKCAINNKQTEIDFVSLSYLQKNIAPSISSVIIHRPNDFYEPKTNNNSSSKGITFPAPLPNKQTKKGFRSVDWLFDDPNFDALSFELYYRRVGTESWRKMETDVEINWHSWDSAHMADGTYEIKIVATDKPANPDDQALAGEKNSTPFIIDNSGPVIETGNNKSTNVLTVRIDDEWNPLGSVEYSIDAGEWKEIYPVDGILDSKTEQFEIPLPGGPHDVAIKASDTIDNVSVVHTMVK